MASAPCSVQHPDKPQVHCNRAATKPHEMHTAYCWDEDKYVSWLNPNFEPTKVQTKLQEKRHAHEQQTAQRRTLRTIAAKIRGTS